MHNFIGTKNFLFNFTFSLFNLKQKKFLFKMASTSGSNKRNKGKETSCSSKRQRTAGNSNTITIPEEEPQWISNVGKTSFVWKFFQAKTNGRAYCRYIDNDNDNNEECGHSCVYKSQTSSMLYHINNVHKEYEKKAEVNIKKIYI